MAAASVLRSRCGGEIAEPYVALVEFMIEAVSRTVDHEIPGRTAGADDGPGGRRTGRTTDRA
ncbi:MAG TPA: hypothetical protein VIQ30_00390, partial [Pseudonocardia sp.]